MPKKKQDKPSDIVVQIKDSPVMTEVLDQFKADLLTSIEEMESGEGKITEDNPPTLAVNPPELPTASIEEESTESNTRLSPEPIEASTDLSGWDKTTTEIVIRGGNINSVISDVLYAAYLGAELTPKFLPRLKSPPFIIKMDIPIINLEDYDNRSDKIQLDPEKVYNTIKISGVDPMRFMKDIVKVGKSGGINKSTVYTIPMHSTLYCHRPVVLGPTTTTLGPTIKYTFEELKEFSIEDLRILGNSYGVTHRSKVNLAKMIVEKQENI